jgi:putative selenium metabolism hydrolase
MDINQLNHEAKQFTISATAFLQDLIAIPSLTCQEGAAILRAAEEMKNCGFDEVNIDPMGNLLGRIGSGSHIIAMDAHIDTVDIGNRKNWPHDPFAAIEHDGIIYGRGAADMKGSVAALIYAGKLIKKLRLDADFTLFVTITVQEEDCEGLSWQYIVQEDGIKPEVVLICEPSDLKLIRGHKGRTEFEITVEGIASHGSEPDKGDNAIYKIIPILEEISQLNFKLAEESFLGKRSIAVTHIQSIAPSLNAIPDLVKLYADRRLTQSESRDSVLKEIQDLKSLRATDAQVVIPNYDMASYTGLQYPMEKYFPTWMLDENHVVLQRAAELYKQLYAKEAEIKKWNFSTNGVATAGIFGIPTFGFGPANPLLAHTVEEQCPVWHLTESMKFYAAFPSYYLG